MNAPSEYTNITLIFEKFELDSTDTVVVESTPYSGSFQDLPPNTNFTSNTFKIVFTSSAIRNSGAGFTASFAPGRPQHCELSQLNTVSVSACSDPGFNEDTTAIPPVAYYGETITVSCGQGYFFAQETYQTKTTVKITCGLHGWDTTQIPQCERKLASSLFNSYDLVHV